MPAYRSDAEAEIREAVVANLRSIMPGCRIINEVNASSFGNRIDVLAVGEMDLIAVEIKSAKDKLDRLPDQIAAMRRVSNRVVAAIHEKFLCPWGPEGHLGFQIPEAANGAFVWAYPRIERKGHVWCGETWHHFDRWTKPMQCLPPGAIGMLWRAELQSICREIDVPGASRLNMDEAVDRIRWELTGQQITRAICATLRARECPEADEPILQVAA